MKTQTISETISLSFSCIDELEVELVAELVAAEPASDVRAGCELVDWRYDVCACTPEQMVCINEEIESRAAALADRIYANWRS